MTSHTSVLGKQLWHPPPPHTGLRTLSLRSLRRRRLECSMWRPSSWECTWRRYSWNTRYTCEWCTVMLGCEKGGPMGFYGWYFCLFKNTFSNDSFSISPHLPRSPLSLLLSLFLPLVLSLPLHLISLTHLLLSLLFSLPGPPAAAVWGCGCDEALRQGHHQCQPAHLPAQQEVLREIDGWDGEMDGKRRRGGYRHCWEQNI